MLLMMSIYNAWTRKNIVILVKGYQATEEDSIFRQWTIEKMLMRHRLLL